MKVGGNRVSTEEVAAALRGHDAVGQAAVIAVEDPTWTNRLEGFVVLRQGAEAGADELRAWLGERMPAYKVPRAMTFIDELPVDTSGQAVAADAEVARQRLSSRTRTLRRIWLVPPKISWTFASR